MGSKSITRYRVLEEYVRLRNENVVNPMKQAIMKVYHYRPDDKYLAQKVSQRQKDLAKTDKLNELFALAGVDKLTIATKLAQLLEAKVPLIYRGQIMKGEDGKEIKVSDHKTQMAATSLASNVLGITQKQRTFDITKQENNNLIVIVEDEKSARKRVKESETEHEIVKESYVVEEAVEQ